jgi:hypothetical protein
MRGKGDAISYFIVIVIIVCYFISAFFVLFISIILQTMDLERITRYIASMQQQVATSPPVNTPPTSIHISSTTTPSNVSTSSQLTPAASTSTSSRRQYDHLDQTSTESGTTSTPPPVQQTRIQDLLDSSSDDDVSEVKNEDNDNDCMIVGTTPPPNRFSSQYSPTPSSQRRRRQGMYYCKHCESNTGCHNSVYGGFLEKEIGDTTKIMKQDEVYEAFMHAYKLIRRFRAYEDILEKKKEAIVMLPYCMYVGTFKRCLTNHVVAGQYAEGHSSRKDPSAHDRLAHLNWVRARGEQCRDARRRKRNR